MSTYTFEATLASAQRINWKIEDILAADGGLDFDRPFLPDSLARAEALPFLDARERRILNQIRGHAYLSIFGLVEEFILPFVLDHARPELCGDDWRVRSNLTLNLGFRYETQTNIHDWRAFAPRIGLAWAPAGNAASRRPKTVIRAGFGMFYDRFPLASTLTARRCNGIVQQQYVITDPAILNLFPSVPSPAA